jgi:hypothetical protein
LMPNMADITFNMYFPIVISGIALCVDIIIPPQSRLFIINPATKHARITPFMASLTLIEVSGLNREQVQRGYRRNTCVLHQERETG